MKATKDNISLETAKLLKDCGVDSESVWIEHKYGWEVCTRKEALLATRASMLEYPAYTWQEIEDNAEVFFGKTHNCRTILKGEKLYYGGFTHIERIIRFRQQKKYKEADAYFRVNNIIKTI